MWSHLLVRHDPVHDTSGKLTCVPVYTSSSISFLACCKRESLSMMPIIALKILLVAKIIFLAYAKSKKAGRICICALFYMILI